MKSFFQRGLGTPLMVLASICLESGYCFSQCSPVDFTSPSQACLNQNLTFTPSASYVSYEWDFCAGDLELTPSAAQLLNTSGSNAIDVILDNGSYYGFYINRNAGRLYRLDFGSTLANSPAVVDLGNMGIDLSSARTIKIAKQGTTFYGFFTGNNSLYRINFGTTISAVPPDAELLSGISLSTPIDMELAQEGGITFLFIVNFGNNAIVRVQINSLSDDVSLFQVSQISVSAATILAGIAIMKDCDNWYALTTAIANGTVFKISFGNTLTNPSPGVALVTGFFLNAPAGISLVEDNGNYYSFVKQDGTKLYRINFGNTLSNNSPVSTDMGSIGMSQNGFAFSLYKEGSKWVGFTSNAVIYKINFPNNCFSVIQSSIVAQPAVSTVNTGSYFISLAVKDAVGHRIVKSKPIQILNSAAPDVAFTSQNVCANSATNFSITNSSGNLNSYAWDFGDGVTDPNPGPSHSYTSAGTYSVNLTVGATNGCTNQTQKPVTIFNQPVADFAMPVATTVCTNQTYTFTNQSTFDAGSNPTWQWTINGSPVSASPDLIQSFGSIATEQIKLVAAIPGCTSQQQQNFDVQQSGPVVDFAASNGCQGAQVPFNNTTAGTGLTFTWDFGDGNSSGQSSPFHIYNTFGAFSVNLLATSMNGCHNSTSKSVTIYSAPQPDFSLDLPPFSCSGSSSQFHDATPNPTDSNLSTWAWHFGDAVNNTSSQKNPLHTYALAGPYTVDMTVTTNFSCSATIQKTITIAQSPLASFNNTPACVNQGTLFIDTSSGAIKTWLWTIGITNYTVKSFTNVFGYSSSFNVQLTVADSNGCVAQTSRPVIVPVTQSPDFSFQGNCATKPTKFSDTSPFTSDPILSQTWDFGGLGSGSGSPAQFVFSSTGNVSVTMDVHAQSGCVYSVTKTIPVVSPPVASFTPSTEAGAAPLNVQFENTSANATGYLWHFHDPTDFTTTITSPEFSFLELGDYIVDLDALNVQGCVDTYSKVIHAVLPRVDAAITDLQFVRDPTSGQLRALFVLDNLGNLPMNNPTIEVELSGGAALSQNLNLVLLPGESVSQILNYTFLAAGLQYVCVRVQTDKDINSNNDKECADVNLVPFVFEPYPNPVHGELHFDWIGTGELTTQITIFNAIGEKAFERKLDPVQSGLNQIKVDVSSLAPGIYIGLFTYPGFERKFRFLVN